MFLKVFFFIYKNNVTLFNVLNDVVQSTLLKIEDKFLIVGEGNGCSLFYVNLWSIFTLFQTKENVS